MAALYRRVLFLASTEHPWLAGVAAGAAEPADFALLHAALLQHDGATIAAAQQQMLLLFHDLLVRLIGASLADRLLPAGAAFPSAGRARQDTSP